MSHYAKIEANIVTQVIVADAEFIATQPGEWVQTSYNTRGGIHYGQDGTPDNGIALRKNYAGIGYTYDPVLDAFIPPKPFESWILNGESCLWEPPVPYPTDEKRYYWDELETNWVEVV